MSERKGGRARTGTVTTTKSGLLQAIITLTDGSRKRMKPFPKGTSPAYAEERAKFWSEEAIRRGIVARPKAPKLLDATSDNAEWLETWLADRVARGYTATRENASHCRLHILTSVGPKHVKDWTRDDLRKLSRDLDTKVQARKMAINVWGTATKMCSDAAESKSDAIRVRSEDPSATCRSAGSVSRPSRSTCFRVTASSACSTART